MQELWTDNLLERFSGFARGVESEILILSPFIKVQTLQSILGGLSQKNIGVITRWRTADIVSGVCDLEIYELLSSRHIPLMVHRQLHMKGIVRDQRELLLSTANITAAGLGDASISNIECATVVRMQERDRHWITQIQRESAVVTRAQYEKFRVHIEKQQPRATSEIDEFSFSAEPLGMGFSVYELPYTETPRHLVEILQTPKVESSFHGWERVAHDADIFGLPLGAASSASILPLLRQNFFSKPIIRALTQFVVSKRYFGEIKRWIRQECCDADTLTNSELIQRVQSVFNWIVELSDGGFTLRRPNYSECLTRLI